MKKLWWLIPVAAILFIACGLAQGTHQWIHGPSNKPAPASTHR